MKQWIYYTDGGSLKTGESGWGVLAIELDLTTVDPEGLPVTGYPATRTHTVQKDPDDNHTDTYPDHYKVLSRRRWYGGFMGTNNQAEIHAIEQALLDAKLHPGTDHHTIISDSEYALNCLMKYIDIWSKANWRKISDASPPANLEYWKRILSLREMIHGLRTQWTKGHADNKGNNIADELATMGIGLTQKAYSDSTVTYIEDPVSDVIYDIGEMESAKKTKKTKKITHDKMLPKHNWYFQTGSTLESRQWNGFTIYGLGNHGPDDTKIRTDISDVTIATVFLKTPDPVLETISTAYLTKDPTEIPKMVYAKLANILAPVTYDGMIGMGLDYTYRIPNYDLFNLFTSTHKLLTNIEQAPRVAWKLFDCVNALSNDLERLTTGKLNPTDLLIDVTKHFYEISGDKTILKKEFNAAKKTIDVSIDFPLPGTAKIRTGLKNGKGKRVGELPLTIGIDTPERNMFSAEAGEKTKVYLFLVEDNHTVSDRANHGHIQYHYSVVLVRSEDDESHADRIAWQAPARNKLFIGYGS